MTSTVLVVDDSAMARKMLIRSLPESWDVTVRQACNGVEALAEYHKGDIDLMFLDLTMPEVDGFQVLETLRAEGLNCLVVVVSADIQPEAQDRVKKLGAIAFVKKPVDAEKLGVVLREYGVAL